MTELKFCAECEKALPLNAKRCACGWLDKSTPGKPIHHCQVREYAKLCASTQDVFNVNTVDRPVYWCLKHYDERRYRQGMEKDSYDGAPVVMEAARKVGLTPREYCKEMFPHMFNAIKKESDAVVKNKQSVREILIKQNSIFGNLN